MPLNQSARVVSGIEITFAGSHSSLNFHWSEHTNSIIITQIHSYGFGLVGPCLTMYMLVQHSTTSIQMQQVCYQRWWYGWSWQFCIVWVCSTLHAMLYWCKYIPACMRIILRMHLTRKSLSDLLNDREDYSEELMTTISTHVTELFTLFNPKEWLLGIRTNVVLFQFNS